MKKVLILLFATILLMIIIYAIYNKMQNDKIIDNVDLSKLNASDLSAYNSLSSPEDKQYFLKVLNSTYPAVNTVPSTTVVNPTVPTVGATGNVPVKTDNTVNKIETWFSNLFHRKKQNYVQILPIDENGIDANGYNAIGIKDDIGF